jgi:predicted CoA-binding protein
MTKLPVSVQAFLGGTRYAVAGVSRDSRQPANHIYRRLVTTGFEVFPVNPGAPEVEGVASYPRVRDVPGPIHGVVVATPPAASEDVVRDAAAAGVKWVWFHRSVGPGSVSAEAVQACRDLGIDCIEGGCPLMFCEPVDIGHRCMRWWYQRKGVAPR